MSRAIIIPASQDEMITVADLIDITQYQDVVGGYVEPIPFDDEGNTLFVNEEGKLRHLQLNVRASLLWHVSIAPNAMHEVLCGDVALVGPHDQDGKILDLAGSLIDLLLATPLYAVEFHPKRDGAWTRIGPTFDDYFVASMWGLSNVMGTEVISGLRITPLRSAAD